MSNGEILKKLGRKLGSENNFAEIEHKYYGNKLIPTSNLFDFYIELDIAKSLSVYDFFQEKCLKILVIDDNISSFENILKLFRETFKIDFYKLKDFDKEVQKIINGEYECIEITSIKEEKGEENPKTKETNQNKEKLENFDIILLDIYFGKGKSKHDGVKVLQKIKWDFPGLPIFMLTKSFDLKHIKECFELESEYFITKNRIAGLPYFIYKFYMDNFGSVIFEFDEERRRFLVRKITEWRRSKTLLWHGDKAQNLVSHSFEHSNCMWKLFNKLYEYDVLPKNNKDNLFAFALAIWLHDIGHKGYEGILEPYEARQKHALISGELLFRYPEIYLGEEKNEIIIKKICLLSAFHKRNSPLNQKSVEAIGGNSNIDKDFFTFSSSFEFLKKILPEEGKKIEIIYLENIDKDLVFWSALLRILDVIDKGLHRVGWGSEEDSKIITAIEDAIYYVKELRKEKESLENNIGDLRYIKQYSSFFDDMNKLINDLRKFIKEKYIEKIKELNKKIRKPEEFVKDAESMYLELYEDINKLKSFNNSVKDKMENLFRKEYIAKIKLLSEQIFFLLDSPLHFYTHRSVKNPSIEKCKDGYKIVYYFNESFIKLPDQKNFTFGDLNRILQEGWKIWSDIYREYIPIKEILKNRVEFKEIEFRYKKDYKDIPLLTLPFNEKFVEAELKLKFGTEKEKEKFIEEIKNEFGLRETKELVIEDSFYDTHNRELRKRKWSLRKRSIKEELNIIEKIKRKREKIKWEIKIEPLYWKGDYEYRIELGPVESEDGNISEIFENLLKNSRLFPNWDELQEIIKIKFNEQPFITYTQKRISFEWNEIEICADTIYKINGNPIKSPLYIVEFEIKKGEPYEKNRKIQEIKEKIKEKIKENLREMEKYICPKTKIELVEEIKNEKNIDSG